MTLIIRNAAQLVCVSTRGLPLLRGAEIARLDIIANGAVLIRDGQIDWIGQSSVLPELPADTQVIDAAGQVVIPGLVDSHTHLIFAGSREDEFEQRLQGKSYQE